MRLLVFATMSVLLVSCKSAQWHFNKALDKGLVIEPETVEVTVTDTLTINGKDSIIERTVEVPCPEVEAPKTRWEVRFDNRRFRDSMRFMRKFYSDSLTHELKKIKDNNDLLSDSLKEARKIKKFEERTERTTVRQENKRSLWWLWMLIGAALTIGVQYAKKRLLSKPTDYIN